MNERGVVYASAMRWRRLRETRGEDAICEPLMEMVKGNWRAETGDARGKTRCRRMYSDAQLELELAR